MYATIEGRETRPGTVIVWPALVAACVALTLAPRQALAQDPISVRGGIGIASTGYQSELYEKFNLPSRSWGFHGTFSPRFYRYFEFIAEFGWEFWTKICLEEACDDESKQTSSLFASLGVGLASPVLFVNDPSGRVGFGLTVDLGQEWASVGLSQDGCVNCVIEDLDADGGLWIEPGVDLYADRSVVIGFKYRIYESSSDLTSRITLRVLSR